MIFSPVTFWHRLFHWHAPYDIVNAGILLSRTHACPHLPRPQFSALLRLSAAAPCQPRAPTPSRCSRVFTSPAIVAVGTGGHTGMQTQSMHGRPLKTAGLATLAGSRMCLHPLRPLIAAAPPAVVLAEQPYSAASLALLALPLQRLPAPALAGSPRRCSPHRCWLAAAPAATAALGPTPPAGSMRPDAMIGKCNARLRWRALKNPLPPAHRFSCGGFQYITLHIHLWAHRRAPTLTCMAIRSRWAPLTARLAAACRPCAVADSAGTVASPST